MTTAQYLQKWVSNLLLPPHHVLMREIAMLTASSTAKEAMQTDLVTVNPSDSLRKAMELLTEWHVSGLPVVDNRGHCIGILSVTDLLGLENEQAHSAPDEEVGAYFNPDKQRWENMRFAGSIDELPDQTVNEVMSADVVSVAPETPLREVAELMVEQRVHRVLVMDDKQLLHGLIAALDLVQIVADS